MDLTVDAYPNLNTCPALLFVHSFNCTLLLNLTLETSLSFYTVRVPETNYFHKETEFRNICHIGN